MITDCHPRLVTANCALSECHLKHRRAWTSSVMEPCSLAEPSTLHNRTGWGSGVASSQCFHTKSQLMNIRVAPESKRVEVAMEVREVREGSSSCRVGGRGGWVGCMSVL